MKNKKYLLCSLIITLVILTFTSGIGNMYVQRKGDNGWIFHVFSQKMGLVEKQPNTPKNINYDYTYLEMNDSVSMLSTVNLPIDAKPKSITIKTCTTIANFTPEIIYIKPKGKKDLEYRLKISYPFTLWKEMYVCEKPFSICYSIMTAGEDSYLYFGYSNSKWKSNREKMSEIIRIIEYNTGKL